MIGIVMGSRSDWETMKSCAEVLEKFGIKYEARVVSAHRTPDGLFKYAENAKKRGIKVIIAGAGGSAHLAGMLASKTLVPILGVSIVANGLNGIDSLLSMIQMPAGVPVGCFGIGVSGAKNAGLFAISMIADNKNGYMGKLRRYRESEKKKVIENSIIKGF